MTCIVGMVHNDKVYIGGDSCSSDDSEKFTRRDPKVFHMDDMLIGFSGSWRFGQILRYKFTPPEKKDEQEDFEYLVTEWLDALRQSCKENGLTKVDDNEESWDGSALIGYNGSLYILDEDLNIGEPLTDYAAIGSGSSVALGALYVGTKSAKQARRVVQKALEAAVEHARGVTPPFTILSI